MQKKQLVVIGSTGILGQLSLDSWQKNFQQDYSIAALIGHTQGDLLLTQVLKYSPKFYGLSDDGVEHQKSAFSLAAKFLPGSAAINTYLSSLGEGNVLLVLNSGIALMPGILKAVEQGADILISNKELVICAGGLLQKALKDSTATLIPLDSEHFAIWQCLPYSFKKNVGKLSVHDCGVKEICLTGSGGSFFSATFEELKRVTVEMASKHPVWVMGKKNSVDSATFMNKGLESIEAAILFCIQPKQVIIARHPEAKIHGAVSYFSGEIVTHYAPSSMTIPIESGLNFLVGKSSSNFSEAISFKTFFKELGGFTFEVLCAKKIPALQFAFQAFQAGDAGCLRFDALNTSLVDSFLKNDIKFSEILTLFQQLWSNEKFDNLEDPKSRVSMHQKAIENFKTKIKSARRNGLVDNQITVSQFDEGVFAGY